MVVAVEMTNCVANIFDQTRNVTDIAINVDLVSEVDSLEVRLGFVHQVAKANHYFDEGSLQQWIAGITNLKDPAFEEAVDTPKIVLDLRLIIEFHKTLREG